MIVALLWRDSGPVVGSDGRIVCLSSEFVSVIRNAQRLTVGLPIAIEVDESGKSVRMLSGIMLEGKRYSEPNQTLRSIATYFPAICRINQIKVKVDGAWILQLSITIDEWKSLQAIKKRGNNIIFCEEFRSIASN